MLASVPPASMASASPCLMRRKASPIAFSPVAHAVDAAMVGPQRPCRMPMFPAAMLMRMRGTKKGLTLRWPASGPRDDRAVAAAATSSRQPIPDPIDTPNASRRKGPTGDDASPRGSRPASASASAAACCAKPMKSTPCDRRLARPTAVSRLNSVGPEPRGTQPAMRVGNDANEASSCLTPERPARRASQLCRAPTPSGVTQPSPVTTTRRCVVGGIGGSGSAARLATAASLERSRHGRLWSPASEQPYVEAIDPLGVAK
jgi:hypothetical protein